MGGFMGWFLTFLLVWVIFYAEKLPAIRAKIEEKFKDSLDAAKEGSKLASDKLKKVKSEIENKKNAVAEPVEPEENTPEEIAEELQVMAKYVPSVEEAEQATATAEQNGSDQTVAAENDVAAAPKVDNNQPTEDNQDTAEEEKPIDLENRY